MKRLKKVLLVIHILLMVLWILSYSAGYVDPVNYWYLSILGLGFFIFTILNILLGCIWLIARKWYFIPVVVLLFCMRDTVKAHWNVQLSADTSEAKEGSLSIMSYNVKNFDLYDWNKAPNTRKDIFQMIRTERPTILCFQEYYSNTDKTKFNNEKYIADSLGYPHHHFAKFLTIRDESWGINIFSRLPIVNATEIPFEGKGINGAMYADIVFEKDTFRVFNMHLQSLHLSDKDMTTLDDATHEKQVDYENTKGLLRKIKTAFIKRSFQINTVLLHVKESPYPYIICGDFNDTPASYAYHRLSQNMQDAFVKKGSGFGRTFDNNTIALRIDYLLLQDRFDIKSYTIIDKNYSDHKPIMATFDYLKQSLASQTP